MAHNGALTEEMKRQIVIELATFRSPPEIRDMLKAEHGVEIALTDIHPYDATKEWCRAGHALRELFHQARKEFVEGVTDQPIASQQFRLRMLHRLAQKCEARGEFAEAGKLLEQAAKECGGLFTNVRQLEGRLAHVHMTPETARAKLADYMKKPQVIEGKASKPPAD